MQYDDGPILNATFAQHILRATRKTQTLQKGKKFKNPLPNKNSMYDIQ